MRSARVSVYAIRDIETKTRKTYRYRTRKELRKFEAAFFYGASPLPGFEVYRTTQDLPRY